ncbi:MAG: hypothetical protein C0502_00590 [Opitutus sp.]|nr:hypothetical protein [Opitutus sp.]
MKTPLRLLLACGLAGALSAQDTQPAEVKFSWADLAEPAVAELAKSGERLIDRIGGSLMVEVERMLGTQGLETAVQTLHLRHLNPPRPVEGKPRVTEIKRTSFRVRNPRNAPDAADLAALEMIRGFLNSGEQPPKLLVQKVERADAPVEWRVYRPISVGPNCLLCHGPVESLQPQVRYLLERYYPEDKATGYNAYDWRGLIRVSYERPDKS